MISLKSKTTLSVCMLSYFSHVWLFGTHWTAAHQAALSMWFSRREYWNGLLCPPPGDLPNQGNGSASLTSAALAGRFFTTSATWEAQNSIQFSSVTHSCPTLCNPMNCSTLGLFVHYQLLEFTQTHVHWVGDAIQPSHPLLPPSPPALNLSQHQGLLKWVSSSQQVAKVLELQLQHQSFWWFPSGLTGFISLYSKGLWSVFSNTTVQKHQFLSAQPSLWSNSHIHPWLLEKL